MGIFIIRVATQFVGNDIAVRAFVMNGAEKVLKSFTTFNHFYTYYSLNIFLYYMCIIT